MGIPPHTKIVVPYWHHLIVQLSTQQEEVNMSNNIKNIKKAVGSTVSAATGIVAVGTEVVADTSSLISNSISATPSVFKALLMTPFSAAKGYLMQAEELTAEQAEAVAFKYITQDVTTTIQKASEGSGKLIAQLFEEDEDPINISNMVEVHDKK